MYGSPMECTGMEGLQQFYWKSIREDENKYVQSLDRYSELEKRKEKVTGKDARSLYTNESLDFQDH